MAYNDRAFYFYHPYPTYSDRANSAFVSPNGKSLGELTADTAALFRIGRKAFDLICVEGLLDEEKEKLSREGGQFVEASRGVFDNAYGGYLELIDGWRENLVELHGKNFLIVRDEVSNAPHTVDFTEVEDSQVMSIIWQIYFEKLADQNPADSFHAAIREAYVFNALREVDNALLGMHMGSASVAAAIDAADSLSNAMAIGLGKEQLTKARREIAYQGAIEKIKRDPRQKEKIFVFECWKEWRETPGRYSSKASFSRDMLTKCEHLKSQKKIEDWCREWEVKNGTQPAQ